MVSLEVDVQLALADESDVPPMSIEKLDMWASLAYQKVHTLSDQLDTDTGCQVTIRLVDEPEIIQLNSDYRGKNTATNVLSFPIDNDFPELTGLDGFIDANGLVDTNGDLDDVGDLGDLSSMNLLGDVVICHSVIVDEAQAQSKSAMDHYAHMVVHGILHLCGYDHQDDVSADEMEALEVEILAQHEIANPYN